MKHLITFALIFACAALLASCTGGEKRATHGDSYLESINEATSDDTVWVKDGVRIVFKPSARKVLEKLPRLNSLGLSISEPARYHVQHSATTCSMAIPDPEGGLSRESANARLEAASHFPNSILLDEYEWNHAQEASNFVVDVTLVDDPTQAEALISTLSNSLATYEEGAPTLWTRESELTLSVPRLLPLQEISRKAEPHAYALPPVEMSLPGILDDEALAPHWLSRLVGFSGDPSGHENRLWNNWSVGGPSDRLTKSLNLTIRGHVHNQEERGGYSLLISGDAQLGSYEDFLEGDIAMGGFSVRSATISFRQDGTLESASWHTVRYSVSDGWVIFPSHYLVVATHNYRSVTRVER